jgi:KTSC domain-containing protein
VPSSLIRSFQYDPASRTLLINFQSGRRYRYSDVPAEIHKGLRAAFAKGAFFNAQIRGRFAYTEESAASR